MTEAFQVPGRSGPAMHASSKSGGPVLTALARTDAVSVLGWLLFVAATLAFWTQFQPFRTLQDYGALTDTTQSNDLRKFGTIGLAAILVGWLWLDGKAAQIFDLARSPIIAVVFAWFTFTSLLPDNASLALNRLVLALITVQIAYAVPHLFSRVEHFIDAFGVCATLMIVACLLGILFSYDLAVHTTRDLVEQTLAGDWRGIFAHKNDLSAMAAVFLFLGLLVARTRGRIWGIAIALAALLLMVMSGGKTSGLSVAPAIVGGLLLVRSNSRAWSALLVYGLIVGMVFITLGGTLFPQLQSFFAALLPDPTFTGRSDVWTIALAAIGRELLLGYGYAVYWDTGLVYAVAAATSSAATFSHSHNGFLEVSLSGGLIGLALVLVWTVILPHRHIETIKRRLASRTDRALVDFLAQVWLFGLMNACLEAVLFNRSNPVWYTVLIAMGCLSAWARSLRQEQ